MLNESFREAVPQLLTELEASANAHDTDRHMAAYANDPSLTFAFNGEVIRAQGSWFSITWCYLGCGDSSAADDPVRPGAAGSDLSPNRP